MKGSLFKASAILIPLSLIGCKKADTGPSKPNLLYIIVDQMREMAMSCSGDENITTTALDNLASKGMRFTRMYTPTPVSSPARASLHTGLFPHNAGVPTNDRRLSEEVPTLAEILAEEGYVTGHIGKWHLDGRNEYFDEDHESWRELRMPGYPLISCYGYVPPERHRGFQYWAGFEHGHQYFGSRYWKKEREAILLPEGVYEPDHQTDLAIEFIRQNRDTSWYLDLNFGTPHFPLDDKNVRPEDLQLFDPASLVLRPNVPAEFEEEAREILSIYYAMIHNLDLNLQRLLETLRNEGILDNTVIVFTSDHGDLMLSHGQNYKRRPQEESTRVPFIVSYPPLVKQGAVADQLLTLVDIFPTLLELIDIEPPFNEGKSFKSLLTGASTDDIHSSIYMLGSPLGCRATDPGYVRNPWRAVRTHDFMMAFIVKNDTELEAFQLYSMNSDPYQMNNLIHDPAYGSIKHELAGELDSWRKKTGDWAERLELKY